MKKIFLKHFHWRNIVINLFLVFISLLITLLGVEVICRMKYKPAFSVWQSEYLFQLDPDLIYSIRPNFYSDYSTLEFPPPVSINSYGMREKEPGIKNPAFKRILVIGDSLTFGHGVKYEESYPKYLENILNSSSSRKFEVLNAGVPGYGTDQEYKFYITRLYKLKPDYLIVSFCNNDVIDNMNHPLYTLNNNQLIPLNPKRVWIYFLGNIYLHSPGLIRKSRLFDHILHRYENKDIFHQLPKVDGYQLHVWSMKKIILELLSLNDMGRQDGFKLIVIRMPDFDLVRTGKLTQGIYVESVFDTLTSSLTQSNIPYIDSNPYFQKLPEKESLFQKDNVHLIPMGNHILAQFAYDSIKSLIN